jgi:hypothetical protein
VPRFSVFSAAIFSALKLLTLKTEPLKPLLTDQPAAKNAKPAQLPPPSVGREAVAQDDSVSDWDFDAILKRLNVNPSSRKRLLELNVPARDFVSWLLQAMTMRGVDPLRVAVAWSLDPRKQEMADPDFRLLAQTPGELRRAARLRALGGSHRYSREWGSDTETEAAYRRALGDDASRAEAILSLLFGEHPAPRGA